MGTRRPDFRAYRTGFQVIACSWCEDLMLPENVVVENTRTNAIICSRCVSDAGISVCELLGYGPEPVPAE